MIPYGDSVPLRRFPLVTVGLIAINFAVWVLYEVPDLDRSVRQLAFFPCEVDDTCRAPGASWPITALTSMFMHGSWLHIIGNMLFLAVFGRNVEDAAGRLRFTLFYLLCGFAATALQTWVTLDYGSRQDSLVPNLGASGAIAGVLGAYLLLYPTSTVRTLLPFGLILVPVRVPAVFFLGVWFLFQLWQGGLSLFQPSGTSGGVAFFAHVGGFVFGVLTVRLFVRRRARAARRGRSDLPY